MSSPIEENLREQVRAALDTTQTSQVVIARELKVSTKHLCQMLTGRAPLTLEWAEKIVNVCGMRVEVVVLRGGR